MHPTAYLDGQRSVVDTDSLVSLATDMGLDPGRVRKALETQQYRGVVENDNVEARPFGAVVVLFLMPNGCVYPPS